VIEIEIGKGIEIEIGKGIEIGIIAIEIETGVGTGAESATGVGDRSLLT
jgi:hypothetical protein